MRMVMRLQVASNIQLQSAFGKVTSFCKNVEICDLKRQSKVKLLLSNVLNIKARKHLALDSCELQHSFYHLQLNAKNKQLV